MKSIKNRLERLEKEQRFKQWFEMVDALERLTYEELRIYAETGELPEAVDSTSLAARPSRLDGLDRNALLNLYEEDELFFAGRSDEEINFYTRSGCWPEGSPEDTEPTITTIRSESESIYHDP